ncbi:MAG: hypothetical protein HY762_06445 [Planctomycetes bacterium]|nr:hypothetical protein [Planctomycetota bacterium]
MPNKKKPGPKPLAATNQMKKIMADHFYELDQAAASPALMRGKASKDKTRKKGL